MVAVYSSNISYHNSCRCESMCPHVPTLSGYQILTNPFACTVCILAPHSNIPFFMPHFRGGVTWQLSQIYLCLNPGLSIAWRVILGKLNFANTTKGRLESHLASPFFPYSLQNHSVPMLWWATLTFCVKYKTKSQY